METLLENKGGEVTVGDVQFRMSDQESALSKFGSPMPIYDGDDFTADPHWIINSKGMPKRKQFVPGNARDRGIVWVWIRKLEDDYLPILEAKYQRIQSEVEAYTQKEWHCAVQRIKRLGGKAHAIPANSDKNGGSIWLYDAHFNDQYECDTIGFKWVDRPKKLIHPDAGQHMYRVSKRNDELWRRVATFRAVLLGHLNRRVYRQLQNLSRLRAEEYKVFVFRINGREYAIEKMLSRHTIDLEPVKILTVEV